MYSNCFECIDELVVNFLMLSLWCDFRRNWLEGFSYRCQRSFSRAYEWWASVCCLYYGFYCSTLLAVFALLTMAASCCTAANFFMLYIFDLKISTSDNTKLDFLLLLQYVCTLHSAVSLAADKTGTGTVYFLLYQFFFSSLCSVSC